MLTEHIDSIVIVAFKQEN